MSQISALGSIMATPMASMAITSVMGASWVAATFHGTALASRGGDFQSSLMPVRATSTNSEWASMRTGACTMARPASSTELFTRPHTPPYWRCSPRISTAAMPSASWPGR
ncbi:hypothetical protein D9M69_713190 [compost metagenome]